METEEAVTGQTGAGVVDTEEIEGHEAGAGGSESRCAEKTTHDKSTTVVRIMKLFQIMAACHQIYLHCNTCAHLHLEVENCMSRRVRAVGYWLCCIIHTHTHTHTPYLQLSIFSLQSVDTEERHGDGSSMEVTHIFLWC